MRAKSKIKNLPHDTLKFSGIPTKPKAKVGKKSKLPARQRRASKIKIVGFCIVVLIFNFCILNFCCFAQPNNELELNFDFNAPTIPTPRIFTPGIDLSGRGFHQQKTWPQGIAAPEVLDTWSKEVGFKGMYRLQYNLWEIHELAKDKVAQNALLQNYEAIIKRVNDAGGIVMLSIFGTPAGLGKVLDKRGTPYDIQAYKELVKRTVRTLSCEKKYAIWYELWSAPDLEGFFLGRKREYFNLYRVVSQGIQELERETKLRIPLGGPGASWWFQNFDNNTVAIPERSLIYELIKYCYHYRLKLDFISWHSYTSDPSADLDMTSYRKSAVALMRDWLTYFHFNRALPLIVEEWNFDDGVNFSAPRGEKSYIAASFIPARLKNMYEAGIDYGLYYCLEDFHDNPEGVVRNTGVFSFDQGVGQYQGLPKASYNAFRMLHELKDGFVRITPGLHDEFVGAIATRNQDEAAILVYNYIDPDIVNNYLSRHIGTLREGERRILLGLIKNRKIERILQREVPLRKVPLTRRLRALLRNALELHEKTSKLRAVPRAIILNLKNLKEEYAYRRFVIDASCSHACMFAPAEEKNLSGSKEYQEKLLIAPYTTQLILLQKKPKAPLLSPVTPMEQSDVLPASVEPVEAASLVGQTSAQKTEVQSVPAAPVPSAQDEARASGGNATAAHSTQTQ